jgi:hypothetical protein
MGFFFVWHVLINSLESDKPVCFADLVAEQIYFLNAILIFFLLAQPTRDKLQRGHSDLSP